MTSKSLRETLLQPTLSNAGKLNFYEHLWREVDWTAINTVSDLQRLPTVDKPLYRRSLMFADEALADAALITHTSGTTGAPTWRHRSLAEVGFINEIFGLIERPPPTGVALVMTHARHGMAMPMPSKAMTFPIAIGDNAELRHAADALVADFRFRGTAVRASSLVGGVQEIALLAQYLLEHGREGDLAQIRTLQLLGFVDRGLRSFVHRAFDQPTIYENFSLTEIFGGATRYPLQENFILERYVIGEVVDEAGTRVTCGQVGELTLTELFPFVQMQPLIRYRTGDVVRLVSDDEDFRFEWWGRRNQCAHLSRGGKHRWVLGYRMLADSLTAESLVAREAHRPYLTVAESGFGRHCLTVSQEADETIRLDIGIRFNPWLEVTRQAFVRGLWSTLRRSVMESQPVRVRIALWHVPAPIDSFEWAGELSGLVFEPAALTEKEPSKVALANRQRPHAQ